MTPEQYWEGDCTLTAAYRKAHELRLERKNEESWLAGAYLYEALLCASPLLRAFVKKGTKPIPYPSEPFALSKAAREKQADRAKENIRAKITGFAASHNAGIRKGGEQASG